MEVALNALSKANTQEILVLFKEPIELIDHKDPLSSPHIIDEFEQLEFEVVQPENNAGGARPFWIILKGTRFGQPIHKWQSYFEDDKIDIVLDGVEIDEFEDLRGRFS